MKNYYLAILTSLIITASSAYAQTSILDLKPGDQLIYEVNVNGDIYHFDLTIQNFSENGITFNYNMPEKNKSARIDITAEAVKNAVTHYNYFNGKDQQLSDQTSVWISRKSFRELQAGKTAMDTGEGMESYTKKEDLSFSYKNNGDGFSVKAFRIDNGKSAPDQRQLWVLNNKSNPLILKMNLGWTIELKEVISEK